MIKLLFLCWVVFIIVRLSMRSRATRRSSEEARLREVMTGAPVAAELAPDQVVSPQDVSLRREAMSPLLNKELRTMLRSPRAVVLLAVLLGMVALCFLFFWQQYALRVTLVNRAQVSRAMFSALFITQYLGLSLISAVMSSTVLTTERENRTLDLLYCTSFSRLEILGAKWLATILFQVVLFVSLLPFSVLSFQLGGVSTAEYVGAVVLIGLAIAGYGMLGLALSSFLRRTILALSAAVAATLVLNLVLPGYRVFGFWGPGGLGDFRPARENIEAGLIAFAVGLGALGLVSTFAALQGMLTGDAAKPIEDKPAFTDEDGLTARRKCRPFYLIDPLARPQVIADGANPVYVKELRVGGLTRGSMLVRLGCAAVAVSVVVVLSLMQEGRLDLGGMDRFGAGIATLVALFTSVTAATLVSSEREEGTMDLLRTTLVDTGAILRAKFAAALRFVGVLTACAFAFPLLLVLGGAFHEGAWGGLFGRDLWHMLGVFAAVLSFGVVFTAVGLVCSSLSRRNTSGIVMACLVMPAMIVSPYALGLAEALTNPSSASGELLAALRVHVAALLSPPHYFTRPLERDWVLADRHTWFGVGTLLVWAAVVGVSALVASQAAIERGRRE